MVIGKGQEGPSSPKIFWHFDQIQSQHEGEKLENCHKKDALWFWFRLVNYEIAGLINLTHFSLWHP